MWSEFRVEYCKKNLSLIVSGVCKLHIHRTVGLLQIGGATEYLCHHSSSPVGCSIAAADSQLKFSLKQFKLKEKVGILLIAALNSQAILTLMRRQILLASTSLFIKISLLEVSCVTCTRYSHLFLHILPLSRLSANTGMI